MFNKAESYVLNDPWLTFSQSIPIIEICLLICLVHFFIETKQTNWDLEVPDLHHEKPLRDSCRIWIKKGLKNWKGILCALYTSKELTGPWWLFFASTSNPGYSLHKFRLKDFFPDNFQKFLHGQRIKKAIQENTFL